MTTTIVYPITKRHHTLYTLSLQLGIGQMASTVAADKGVIISREILEFGSFTSTVTN
jgi:hypothetical protein